VDGQAARGRGAKAGETTMTSRGAVVVAVMVAACGTAMTAQAPKRPVANAPAKAAAKAPAFFTTSLGAAEMAHKQAVVATSAGTFVIELLASDAPNHVGYFIKNAREGAYTSTTFHRAIKLGIIQGGDPLSKDPGKRALYGTGGLGVLKAEFNAQPMTAGAVAAVLQPGKPDSAGAQFFVLVTDQPALQGQFTVFGRVVEGLEVAQALSESAVDADGKVVDRVEIASVTIRDTPPPEVEPFSTETVEELARYRVVLETTRGHITLAFAPDKAPGHVRNFLRLASLGAYDGTSFHRIVKGFVVQGGMLESRKGPVPQTVKKYVRLLPPEFNDILHVKGTLSMARTDDPASASTSFFICTGPSPMLDGKYSAFGHVVDGMPAVEALDAVKVFGEMPRERVEVVKARVVRSDQ
jgi:peptidyl-prolyl cis-trans isomerase B (cyclophilin B)